MLLLMKPRVCLAFWVASAHCRLMSSFSSTSTPQVLLCRAAVNFHGKLSLPYQATDLLLTQEQLSFGILSDLLPVLHCSPWDILGDLRTQRGVSWGSERCRQPWPCCLYLPRGALSSEHTSSLSVLREVPSSLTFHPAVSHQAFFCLSWLKVVKNSPCLVAAIERDKATWGFISC